MVRPKVDPRLGVDPRLEQWFQSSTLGQHLGLTFRFLMSALGSAWYCLAAWEAPRVAGWHIHCQLATTAQGLDPPLCWGQTSQTPCPSMGATKLYEYQRLPRIAVGQHHRNIKIAGFHGCSTQMRHGMIHPTICATWPLLAPLPGPATTSDSQLWRLPSTRLIAGPGRRTAVVHALHPPATAN